MSGRPPSGTEAMTYQGQLERNRVRQREYRESIRDGTARGWRPDPSFVAHRHAEPTTRATPFAIESTFDGALFVMVVSRVCRCGARSFSGLCPFCTGRVYARSTP